MAKAWDQYAKEMFKKFGYLATWTPGVQLELGDVGVVKDSLFTRITTLKNLGIPFDVRKDTTKETQKHTSSGSVSITFKGAGKIPAAGSVYLHRLRLDLQLISNPANPPFMKPLAV